MDVIRIHISTKWGLKKQVVVGLLNKSHVMIKVAYEVDFAMAWTRYNHRIESVLFHLFKWTWDYKLGFDSPIAPVWAGLPGLDFGFCITSYFKSITAPLSKFLVVDLPTHTHTRPHYARVCVELDLTKPRPINIKTDLENGKAFIQPVIYENIPKYFTHCCLLGHELSTCKRMGVHKGAGKRVNEIVTPKENIQQNTPPVVKNKQKWIPK